MGLVYNFDFAELAISFIETGDTKYLKKLSELNAADHILNHALRFNYDVPTDSKLSLVTHLLTPISKYKEILPQVVKNLDYAKKHITNCHTVEKAVLDFLPKGFSFSGSIFFTWGYDIGVAFGNNCSLNLAHPIFLKNMSELKYYAVHELHHAGFIALKGHMPSFEISTRKEMASIIEYLTHLEGMGTYAPLNIRLQDKTMNNDSDYIAIQDSKLMKGLIKEYFDIYHYFKDNPDETLVEEDWHKISILSDVKRLWYIVGAHIAKTIEMQLGRECLTKMIFESSENFISAYLNFNEV